MNKKLLILLAIAAVLAFIWYNRRKKAQAQQVVDTKAAIAADQLTPAATNPSTGSQSLLPTGDSTIVFELSDEGYLETTGSYGGSGIDAIYPDNGNVLVING